MMFTKAFAIASLERASKSAAQAALLVFGADQVNALHASWADVGGFALGGFVLSVLTSVASSGVGGAGPSLANEVTSPPAPMVSDDPRGMPYTGGH